MLRINGGYFSRDSKYGILPAKGSWDVYRLCDNFKSYYVKSYKYLRDAKQYIIDKEANARKSSFIRT